MARGELLRKLLLSHIRGDEANFRSTAMQIIAEEEQKKNHQLAKALLSILDSGALREGLQRATNGNGIPKDRERESPLVDVRHPSRSLDDIVLNACNVKVVNRILDEQRRRDILAVHALEPSSKLLFCGPPGCGKTLCAEVVAGELELPLLYVRFDAVVSSYLGETAANLRKVFDYASTARWVLFFDEFDAIGKGRDDPHEHGELKRVVNSFLQLLDNFRRTSVVIAATNHEKLLDTALWRRFDEVVTFPKPGMEEIRSLLRLKLRNFPHSSLNLTELASQFKGLSHAEIERICVDAIRAAILDYREEVDEGLIAEATSRQKRRSEAARIGRSGRNS